MKYKQSIFSAQRKKWLWLWLGLELGALIGWMLWWWLQEKSWQEKAQPAPQLVLTPQAEPKPVAPRAQTEPKPAAPDDLTQINGIGPKYAQILADAGVYTFRQLAAKNPEELQSIFRSVTGRTPGSIETWIEQAAAK